MSLDILSGIKRNIMRMMFGSYGRGLVLAITLCGLMSSPSVAKSYARIVLGVESIEVSIRVDADESSKDLIDTEQLRERVIDYVTRLLSDSRPDIAVRLVPSISMQERKRIESGTLAVALTLTVRAKAAGSADLSCCFGAVTLRTDRDAVRRGREDELIYTEDDYRRNFPAEPIFLGNEQSVAVDRTVEVSAKLLERALSTLNYIPQGK